MRSHTKIIEELLKVRGLTGTEGERVLNPDFERDVHNPMLLKGMTEAVDRIIVALSKKESIVVFGDYDADGIPATALMVRGLRKLGADVSPLIPARSDGYGLTDIAVATLLECKSQVIITVDNGTVSKAEVAALSKHADVIIIDHHEPQEGHVAMDAHALINPKQVGCAYPFKELCACGLVWKFLVALHQKLDKPWDSLKWELDLVALSTVADMVPLLDENRALVFYGLKVLAKTRNLGLKALADVAGFSLEDVSAGDIGFKLAPRINAPSRMHLEVVNGNNAALKLLTTEDTKEADTLARYLNHQNSERQALVEAHLAEAYAQAEAYADDMALVVYHADWSTGVIGLVASKLLEKYSKPVLVLAPEGLEIKGSVRSLGDIEALKLLEAGKDFLVRFGGHAKAAGLTMNKGTDIDGFRRAVNSAACLNGITQEDLALAAERSPDMSLDIAEASLELAQALTKLAPFGLGFPTPRFRAHAHIVSARPVGKEKQHLSCFLEDEGTKRKAIAFRKGEMLIDPEGVYEVDFCLEVEDWNNVKAPSCVIQRIVKQ
jgi:single-stranded-DNA-specific exonuclease